MAPYKRECLRKKNVHHKRKGGNMLASSKCTVWNMLIKAASFLFSTLGVSGYTLARGIEYLNGGALRY